MLALAIPIAFNRGMANTLTDSVEGMDYRQLGSSDLRVSEISLGSWLTYGGGVERAQAEACVAKAFEGRDQLHRYGKRLRARQSGGVPRRGAGRPPPRVLHPRDEAVRRDVRHRSRSLTRAGAEADRRVSRAAAHGPRRSLSMPPLRLGHAARGDDAGADGRRQGGQGALPRLQRVAPGQDQRGPRAAGSGDVRVESAAVLNAVAARAGALRALRAARHLPDRVVATRTGRAHGQVQAR